MRGRGFCFFSARREVRPPKASVGWLRLYADGFSRLGILKTIRLKSFPYKRSPPSRTDPLTRTLSSSGGEGFVFSARQRLALQRCAPSPVPSPPMRGRGCFFGSPEARPPRASVGWLRLYAHGFSRSPLPPLIRGEPEGGSLHNPLSRTLSPERERVFIDLGGCPLVES
jgi:hypothetical protein